jgi:hypothetical protein
MDKIYFTILDEIWQYRLLFLSYSGPCVPKLWPNMIHKIDSRGRCCDHNLLRFLTIFGEKIGVFLKNQCYDKKFAQFSIVFSQKRQFFPPNFSAKTFKSS